MLKFTPKKTGYWKISATCALNVTDKKNANLIWKGSGTSKPEQLASYTLDITHTGHVAGGNPDSGTVVTDGKTNVHAGWPIQLGAELSPIDLTAKFTWTIQGAGPNGAAAINGYVSNATTGAAVVAGNPPPPQASVVTLVPGNDTKSTFPDPSSPGILKSYYYTQAGSETANVTPTGSGIPPAKTTFNVAKAQTSLTVNYEGATHIVKWGTLGGKIGLGPIPAASPYGINFSHPPVHNTKNSGTLFQGTSYFVQVYTENDLWTGIAPVQNWPANGSGLDGGDPYDQNNQMNGSDFVIDNPIEVTDRASNLLNYSSLKINDSPEMWVMYHPEEAGSIDVPLASCKWRWGGTVTATHNAANNTWSPPWNLANETPTAAGPVPVADPTNEYPAWSQILSVPVPPN